MTLTEAKQQLEQLEPIPPPPPGPTYDHIVGNQIRWTLKVFRYWHYQRKVRKLEAVLRQSA